MKSCHRFKTLAGLVVLAIAVFAVSANLQAKNLIKNGEFDDGDTNWTSGWVNTGDGGVIMTQGVNTEGYLSGENCLEIVIENGGVNTWDIQRTQSMPLEAGITYEYSFMAMFDGSEDSIQVTTAFEINADPWTKYLYETITLYNNDPKVYGPFEYTPEEDDATNEVKFFIGGTDWVTIFLDAIVVDDGEEDTAVETVENGAQPADFILAQNYPNPFNPATQIRYNIPSDVQVNLSIYDLQGRTIANLVNQTQPAGSYVVDFNASELASGTYFYRLEAGSNVATKKMILIK